MVYRVARGGWSYSDDYATPEDARRDCEWEWRTGNSRARVEVYDAARRVWTPVEVTR